MTLKLGFVSPLPPVRSGIADYAADLLPELASRCDLLVARLPGQEVSPAVRARYETVELAELADRLGKGGLPLYQVGNNVHHVPVIESALEHPGVLTLHDLFLHHVLQERTLRHHDLDGYVRALVADHGFVGAAVALAPRWRAFPQAGLFALPAHRTLLERQRGVVVHSDWAARELALEGIAAPVRVVPMPMPVPANERDAGREVRRRLGVAADAFVLGSFGFQTPIKRTDVVVRALGRPGLERAHLLVVGELARGVDLEATAHEVGVGDRIHVLGFVTHEEYAGAVAACDLCVNLRHPTAGETSASLLRLFALGRAAVVSDYAQFAELPDEVAVRAPLPAVAEPDEVEALAAILRALAAAPERCRAMGDAARRLVLERHDPGRVAASLVEICREILALPGRTPAEPGTRGDSPPTTLTWGAVRGSIEVGGLDAWRAGDRRTLRVVLRNDGIARWLTPEHLAGGVALECRLIGEDGEDSARLPWIPLPRPLDPGGALELALALRRPPGRAVLRIVPHVIGGWSFEALDGPTFERVLEG